MAIRRTIVAVTIECSYEIQSYFYETTAIFLNAYTCNRAALSTECDKSDEVAGVSRNHLAGKSRNDVKMIQFQGSVKLSRVPRKIGKYFPNLEALRIPVASLPEVHKEDFKGLRKLRILYLGFNNLKTLDSDVFDYVPNLEYLVLDSNPQLSHVGYGILDHLAHLRILHWRGTKCTGLGDVTDGNSQAIENFKNQLRTSCPPTPEMMLKSQKNKNTFGSWDDVDDTGDEDFGFDETFFSNMFKRFRPQFEDIKCEQRYGF